MLSETAPEAAAGWERSSFSPKGTEEKKKKKEKQLLMLTEDLKTKPC